MKLKMVQHNGAGALIVTGTHQQLIIKEEDGGFVLEMVGAVTPVLAFEEENCACEEDAPPQNSIIEEETPAPSNIMFEKLVVLRTTLATADKVPPYMIFHNKTLHEMADKLPADMQALGSIAGVGQSKLEKYGNAFLSVINGGAA